MKIILGSSSIYRKAVLEEAGYECEVISPDVSESDIFTPDFFQRPLILARAKSEAIRRRVTEPALIVTADIIVVCDGKLYEKPRSAEEARIFLKKYSEGHPAETICALVVFNTKTGKSAEGVDRAKTYFKPLPESVIEEFIRIGNPLTRAGGFGIQVPILKRYIEKIEGTAESIIGMPIHLLEKLLQEAQFSSGNIE